MTKIVMAVTSADYLSLKNGAHSTGFWAEEVVVPYETFTRAGVDVDITTPDGEVPHVDEASLSPEMNGGDTERVAYLREQLSNMATRLETPQRLQDVAGRGAADANAVFIPGGHGPMEDLPGSADLGRILINMCDGGKPVVAICHGPAGLLAAERDGAWPFAGFRLTAFTNAEEEQVGLAQTMTWLLETRLRSYGAEFQEGPAWQPHVVTDRNLITGQNPQSAGQAAERTLDVLRVTAGT